MTIPTQQQAYGSNTGTSPIPAYFFRDHDPTQYNTTPNYQLYSVWVNTVTKGIWYLEAFLCSSAVITSQWRAVAPIVVAAVAPASPLTASADYAYPIGQTWVNSTLNDYFVMVSNPTDTTGYWIKLSAGTQGVDLFNVDASTAPGSDPVGPDSDGIITVTGGQVAAATTANVIQTNSLAANTYTIQVQRSTAVAATDITKNGVSHYASDQFAVDANGFVTLKGGSQAIDSIQVDAFTAPGTNPVLPSVAGLITVTGGQVATGVIGANVIRTNSFAANTYTTQIQQSTAVAAQDTTKNGVAHFDSARFTCVNGFVSLVSASSGLMQMNLYTTTQTFTPETWMDFCIIECIGGGGGGGGAGLAGAGAYYAAGSGGGAGAYARNLFTAAQIGASKAITIGAGGAGGSGTGGVGSTGGNTSVGALIQANGGVGGVNNYGNNGTYAPARVAIGGQGGQVAIGLFSNYGEQGGDSFSHQSFSYCVSGKGGTSWLGAGGSSFAIIDASPNPIGYTGNGGAAYGSGGGGAGMWAAAGGTSYTGGLGADGVVIITQFG